jgi:hypothetical protein
MFEHVINWILQNELHYTVHKTGIIFSVPDELKNEFMSKWNAYCSEVKE